MTCTENSAVSFLIFEKTDLSFQLLACTPSQDSETATAGAVAANQWSSVWLCLKRKVQFS